MPAHIRRTEFDHKKVTTITALTVAVEEGLGRHSRAELKLAARAGTPPGVAASRTALHRTVPLGAFRLFCGAAQWAGRWEVVAGRD